jgi:hypothetical protein
MELLKKYFELQKEIFAYFGYVQDWRIIPLSDYTEMHWQLFQESDGSGFVVFHESKDSVISQDGNHYSNEIYTQRFLPKWVYRGAGFTMVCADTHTDGNKLLQVFDNAKEVVAV